MPTFSDDSARGALAGGRKARLGFGRSVALSFALIAASWTVLAIVVGYQVGRMNTLVRRVLEEQREAGHSRDLVQSLQTLQTHVDTAGRSPGGAGELAERAEWLEAAQVSLNELREGPDGRDPSSSEHESTEVGLYAQIEQGLAEMREHVGQDRPEGAFLETLARTRERASVLRDEMRDEAHDSSRELRDRARAMRSEVLWTTALALVVLAGVLWLVRRRVVRPVQHLRDGARRIARGELSHRVAISSNDEMGELAAEFNRMAGEVQGMRSELERRVEERTQEFLRAARLAGLGSMAAGIAHEINNPLASIASCAEGLERKLQAGKLDPEQQREYLQIIAREAYRAHDITSKLLEFSRKEGGAIGVFDTREMLHEIQVLLEHALQAKELHLAVECDGTLTRMRGNPSECKQVLLNLIHNAIDASPRGGTIRVRCGAAAGEAILEVEDQGAGIAPADRERIFDPFFTTKAPGQGTGLGLAIVHRIIERHGGRIEVLGGGCGALIRVRMPNPGANGVEDAAAPGAVEVRA